MTDESETPMTDTLRTELLRIVERYSDAPDAATCAPLADLRRLVGAADTPTPTPADPLVAEALDLARGLLDDHPAVRTLTEVFLAEALLAARPSAPTVTTEQVRDVLAGWPIGSGYYSTTVGTGEAAEMADAVLAALGIEVTP